MLEEKNKFKNTMGKAVLHFEKCVKPTSGSLGHHIDREVGMEWSYRHADLSKTHLNKLFEVNDYCKMKFNDAICKRVADGHITGRKLRDDAVYSVNTILSGSHEEMLKIFSDERKKNDWINENFKWCCEQFGRDNIVRFALHLDEKTPHIHCVWVPIKDGRLSAREYLGGSKLVEKLQTSYANAMSEFGLKRGVKSDRKHQSTEDYYRKKAQEIENLEDVHQKIDDIGKSSILFGLNDLKKDLKLAVNQVFEKEKEKNFKFEKKIKSDYLDLRNEVKEISNNFKPFNKKYIPQEDVERIVNNSNLIDYFLYLASRGHFSFDSKSGKEFIFVDENKSQKISVSQKGWHDLKSGEGGQIIKAIQKFQKLSWLEAVNWLKNFSEGESTEMVKIREKTAEKYENLGENTYAVTQIISPSNFKLINYFKNRGISEDTLREYAHQIHYQVGDNNYFGIGFENNSGGYEIRNPFIKMKIGGSDISELGNKSARKVIVCEGMTDIFSMIEILKSKGKNLDDYRFVSLNSITNADKFIQRFCTDTESAFFLILDADEYGSATTKKIVEKMPNSKDVRDEFGIYENGYNDLNEHLMKNQEENEQTDEQFLKRGIRR